MPLTVRRFTNLMGVLEAGIDQLCRQFGEFVRKFLLKHAKQLAQCSRLQIEEIKQMLRNRLGAGTHMNNAVDKAIMFGEGKMAAHLVANRGITAKTFGALAKPAQRQLNIGVVLIKQRNNVVSVPAAQLTDRQTRRAVSGKHPSWGIIPPADQNKPRAVRPAYYKLTGWRLDGSNSVVLTWALKASTFKSRVTVARFKAIAAQLP